MTPISQLDPSARRGPHALRVARVVEETADARSFVLDVPEPLRRDFDYAPGQYLTVEAPFEGLLIRRCYSLSSTPGIDDAPRFTVKRVPGGRMSNLLIDSIREGDVLSLHPPAGGFVLDPSSARPLELFAGGSGITPVFSILKATLAEGRRPVRLLYANRNAESTIFARELDALAAAHPDRFVLRHHHDEGRGVLTEGALAAWLEGAPGGGEGADHYVCGPAPFMELVHAALERAGVAEERVRVERFVSPADPDRRVADAEIALPSEAPADFLVTLQQKIHRVRYEAPATLLAACKAAGVRAPSSCEDGFCGSCMARLVEGEVEMQNPLALSDRDALRGRILACQARPKSPSFLHVDFDAVSFSAAGAGEDGIAPRISRPRLAAVVALGALAAILVRWLHSLV